MRSQLFSLLALSASVTPLFAITVTTPSNGAPVTSPFSLVASTGACGSQPAVSMGYSLDYGSTAIMPTSFSAMVIAGNGQHILHVKCWGSSGASGVTDVNITVVSASSAPPSHRTLTTSRAASSANAICMSQRPSAVPGTRIKLTPADSSVSPTARDASSVVMMQVGTSWAVPIK